MKDYALALVFSATTAAAVTGMGTLIVLVLGGEPSL